MLTRPESCCNCGSYECSVPMPLRGRVVDIDFCIASIVAALNAAGIETTTSCCGHGTQPGAVSLADGSMIWVGWNLLDQWRNGDSRLVEAWRLFCAVLDMAETMTEACGERLMAARNEPLNIDISDYSDEYVAGFLAGQAHILDIIEADHPGLVDLTTVMEGER